MVYVRVHGWGEEGRRQAALVRGETQEAGMANRWSEGTDVAQMWYKPAASAPCKEQRHPGHPNDSYT